MEEIIQKIAQLTDIELQEVMKAIAQRFADSYSQWDILYLALHKDPVLRQKELEAVGMLIDSCAGSFPYPGNSSTSRSAKGYFRCQP